MKDEVYTTCRDLGLKLIDAGVPVRFEREGRVNRWWYPAWAGRAQQLIKASLPPTRRRVVLSALAYNEDRRKQLLALDAKGDAAAIRAFLEALA